MQPLGWVTSNLLPLCWWLTHRIWWWPFLTFPWRRPMFLPDFTTHEDSPSWECSVPSSLVIGCTQLIMVHRQFASSSRSLCYFPCTCFVYSWTCWGHIWRSWRAELINLQRWVMSPLYACACWRFRQAPSGMSCNLMSYHQHPSHLMCCSQICQNCSTSGLPSSLASSYT